MTQGPTSTPISTPMSAPKSTPSPTGSMLRERLDAGLFVMTAEVVPPLSCDPEELLAKARPLRGLADAVNVTDGAGARAHLGALTAAAILAREGIEPILQMTCRDRNRIALQGDLLGAAASGIHNLLILSGDDPKAGDQPDAKPVFDLDSRSLIETAQAMCERGVLPSGRAIVGAKPDFLIGAADMPIDPAPGWKPAGLAAKVAAGARFTQTQFCMDAGVVRRYVGRLMEEGLGDKISILIGVSPLRSAKSARWMTKNLYGTIIPDATIDALEQAPDPVETGRRIAIELVCELATIRGVAGIHVMAPANEASLADFLNDARRALPRERQSSDWLERPSETRVR
jgi:methylenetetrahydrofolate reductase (NADPH)